MTDEEAQAVDRAKAAETDVARLRALLVELLLARALWDSKRHILDEMHDGGRDKTDEFGPAVTREQDAEDRYYAASDRAREEIGGHDALVRAWDAEAEMIEAADKGRGT